MHIHFINDFALRLRFEYADGSLAPVPQGEITVTLSTSSFGPVYVADTASGTLRAEGNSLAVFAPGHRLTPGDLVVAVAFALPDGHFPGGVRRTLVTAPTGVTLTRSHSCLLIPDRVSVTIVIPFCRSSGPLPEPDNPDDPDNPGSGDATEEEVDSAIGDAFGSIAE